MTWLKKWWGWLVGGLAAIIGLAVAIMTLGGVRPKPPPAVPKRPELPDVEIPDPEPLDTTPADDYHEHKVEPIVGDGDRVIDDLNRRHE